jgi:hypothetical protein
MKLLENKSLFLATLGKPGVGSNFWKPDVTGIIRADFLLDLSVGKGQRHSGYYFLKLK